VRIVTLDAAESGLFAHVCLPIAILPAMHASLPVAVDCAVTLGTQLHHIRLRDLRAVVVHECIAIRRVMAVETETVVAVVEVDVLVLVHGPVVMPLGGKEFVALHAIVRPTQLDEVQPLGGARRRLVKMRVSWQSDGWLRGGRAGNDG